MNRNILAVSVTILLGCLVLGGFYYAVQVAKQNSIERQHQVDIDAENAKIKEAERKATDITLQRNTCLSQADQSHWDYLKLNGTVTTGKDGKETVNAQQHFFDYADSVMKDAKDACFRMYPQ